MVFLAMVTIKGFDDALVVAFGDMVAPLPPPPPPLPPVVVVILFFWLVMIADRRPCTLYH